MWSVTIFEVCVLFENTIWMEKGGTHRVKGAPWSTGVHSNHLPKCGWCNEYNFEHTLPTFGFWDPETRLNVVWYFGKKRAFFAKVRLLSLSCCEWYQSSHLALSKTRRNLKIKLFLKQQDKVDLILSPTLWQEPHNSRQKIQQNYTFVYHYYTSFFSFIWAHSAPGLSGLNSNVWPP